MLEGISVLQFYVRNYNFVCLKFPFRLANGTAFAWGGDSYGQLGDGTAGSNSQPIVVVLGLSNVQQICGGEGHTLALLGNIVLLLLESNKLFL